MLLYICFITKSGDPVESIYEIAAFYRAAHAHRMIQFI